MRMGCCDLLLLVCLLISLVSTIVCFVSPHWLINKDGSRLYHSGLWTQCSGNQCDWFLEEEFSLQNHLPGKFEPRREKTGFCICENKDADQLRGNREADQRL